MASIIDLEAALRVLEDDTSSALGELQRRRAANRTMKKLADNASDSSVELQANQKAAMLNDMQVRVDALQVPLDAAKAALTP